jgi:hypothetical protein
MRERWGWRVGLDRGAARWCPCLVLAVPWKTSPFTRETDIERSMDRVTRKKYRRAAPGELAVQKKCIKLTDKEMTRSNQKTSNCRELRAL